MPEMTTEVLSSQKPPLAVQRIERRTPTPASLDSGGPSAALASVGRALNASSSVARLGQLQQSMNDPATMQRMMGPPLGETLQVAPPVVGGGVLQMVKYLRHTNGQVSSVADGHKKKPKEKWVDEAAFINATSKRGAASEEEEQRLIAERAKKQALRDRKVQLAPYPRAITRSDNNFARETNSRGAGKAHLTDQGLAAAGGTAIPSTEQLLQNSPNKGTSNLISFTGPNPRNGGQQYGAAAAPTLTLKARKLMRARIKGKPDAQHLDVITSAALMGLAGGVAPKSESQRLQGYVTTDDEHQVRVNPVDGVEKPVIAPRFMRLPNGTESHDSDSESEDDS